MVDKVTTAKWLVRTQFQDILGPFQKEDIEKLLREKKITSHDNALFPGGEWQPLNKFQEFQPVLKELLPHAYEDRTRVVHAIDEQSSETNKQLKKIPWQPILIISLFLILGLASYQLLFRPGNVDNRTTASQKKLEKLYEKALSYEGVQEWDKALGIYEQLQPETFSVHKVQLSLSRVYYLKGEYVKSQEILKEILKEIWGFASDDVQEVYLYLGLNEMVFESYVEALSYFQKAVQADAKFLPALFNMGACHYFMNDLAQAKLYFETYFLNSKEFEPHLFLGHVYQALKEVDKAQASYEKAQNLNPRMFSPYYYLAELQAYYFRSIPKALAIMEDVLNRDPHYEKYYYKKPYYFYEKNKERWEALSRYIYISAKQKQSRDPNIQIRMGFYKSLSEPVIWKDLVFHDAAYDAISSSILGVMQFIQGEFSSVQYLLEQSLNKKPNGNSAQLYLGHLFLAQKELDQAKNYYQSLVNQDETSVEGLTGLGNVFFEMKDKDTASYFWKRALEFDPSYIPAKKALLENLPDGF